MRSILKLTLIGDFKFQKAEPGDVKEFDLAAYSVLQCFPYITHGNDAEMKKTNHAWYIKVKPNGSTLIEEQKNFFCSAIEIENV